MRVLIAQIQSVGVDMKLFRLTDIEQKPFSTYAAGAHVDVITPSGHVRQYSLCGDPGDHSQLSILVKRERVSRGGSASMHALSEGDVIEIGQPRNAFSVVSGEGPHLLVSAGVGITPIISMAHQLASGLEPFTWLHFARSSHLKELRDVLPLDSFRPNLLVEIDRDRQQIPLALTRHIASMSDVRHVYACGPAEFMNAVRDITTQKFRTTNFHSEKFSGTQQAHERRSFSVRLAASGLTLDVSDKETLLEALEKHGVRLPTGCLEGICGTCITEVLEGHVIHLDDVLTDDEKCQQQLICPCVSRAIGVLTLKL
ncbi:PDR/VanB family oxidoreductase [Burkholderia cepacia]|uniref:PDR/VanB family oxidoreductase n=1 Tax=Burkholderia cepacia TaxID=292 RepID=UPI001CF39C77|nr:PDR/VanB family oxidoreductase [Burkholderia cepacia]MCA8031328.1 PDR/VanB family oxidoreductase [Burkholderia cepacia]